LSLNFYKTSLVNVIEQALLGFYHMTFQCIQTYCWTTEVLHMSGLVLY